MAKGFDLFMQNPYWVSYYNNAPSDNLKNHIFNNFEYSISALEPGYQPERRGCESLNQEEIQYLYDNAVGGPEKAFYKEKLLKFDNAEQSG